MFSSSVKHAIRRVPVLAAAGGAVQREVGTFLARRPLVGPIPAFAGASRLEVGHFSSLPAYLGSGETQAAGRKAAVERALAPATPRPFTVEGRCAICDASVAFACDFAYAHSVDGHLVPNWRESLACPRCGFRNRMRGALHVLLQEYAPAADADIFLTEQLTRTYRWLKGRFPRTIGSEYMGSHMRPGAHRRGIRHEDLQQLSFDTGSFDLIASFDVLEHVPRLDPAIREMHRVLKPGGRIFFTAPMVLTSASMLTRAVMQADGSVQHVLPPEYHGNPTDPAKGSLCFRYFGWDVLDHLRDAGFADAEVVTWWSREFGYLQYPQFAVTARRRPLQ